VKWKLRPSWRRLNYFASELTELDELSSELEGDGSTVTDASTLVPIEN